MTQFLENVAPKIKSKVTNTTAETSGYQLKLRKQCKSTRHLYLLFFHKSAMDAQTPALFLPSKSSFTLITVFPLLDASNQKIKPDIHFYNEKFLQFTIKCKIQLNICHFSIFVVSIILLLQDFRERFSGIRITLIHKLQVLALHPLTLPLQWNHCFLFHLVSSEQ